MDPPDSMKAEVLAFGEVYLQTWLRHKGSFSLAVAYSLIFWPDFVEFEGYIFRKDFSERSLRGFEASKGITRRATEWVMNHIHITDIHLSS